MANVSSDSFGINAQTWDVFKNKVQNLRQQTNHVRDIMEEEKFVFYFFFILIYFYFFFILYSHNFTYYLKKGEWSMNLLFIV